MKSKKFGIHPDFVGDEQFWKKHNEKVKEDNKANIKSNPKDIDDLFQSITALLNINSYGGTENTYELLQISCNSEFEPHGRASETWEEVWRLKLPQHQAYWKSTKGWKSCIEGITMSFKGRTLQEVLERAYAFLYETRDFK